MQQQNLGNNDMFNRRYYEIGRIICDLSLSSLPPCQQPTGNNGDNDGEMMHRNVVRFVRFMKNSLGNCAKRTIFDDVEEMSQRITGYEPKVKTEMGETSAWAYLANVKEDWVSLDDSSTVLENIEIFKEELAGFGADAIPISDIDSPSSSLLSSDTTLTKNSLINTDSEEVVRIAQIVLSYQFVVFKWYDLWNDKLRELTDCGDRMLLLVMLKLECDGLIHAASDYRTPYLDMATIYYKETRINHLENLSKYRIPRSLYFGFTFGKPGLRRQDSRPWIDQVQEFDKKHYITCDEENKSVIANIYAMAILQMHNSVIEPADILILNRQMMDDVMKNLQLQGLLIVDDLSDEDPLNWTFKKIKRGLRIDRKLAIYGIDSSFLNFTYEDLHDPMEI